MDLNKTCARNGCYNFCRKPVNKYCSQSCSMKTRFEDPTRNPFVNRNPAKTDGSYSSSKNAKLLRVESDNYCCKRCGSDKLGGRSNMYGVHHIVPFKLFEKSAEAYKIRDSQRNLITLCGSCHKIIEVLTTRLLYDMYMNGYDYKDLGTLMDDLRERIETNYEPELIDLS